MIENERPITIPTDLKSIFTAIVFIGSVAFAASSFKGQLEAVQQSDAKQDLAIERADARAGRISGQLDELQRQNAAMLDLICDGDGARNRHGCRLP